MALEASDGASDYGNKFGEPVLSGGEKPRLQVLSLMPLRCRNAASLLCPPAGFARSFGMRLKKGERREWIKPIMFSGGLGSIEDAHVKKEGAEEGNAEAVFTHVDR